MTEQQIRIKMKTIKEGIRSSQQLLDGKGNEAVTGVAQVLDEPQDIVT